MKNRFDEAKVFKNGNINVKLFPETIEKWEKGRITCFEALENALDAVDTYRMGDMFNVGNFDCAMMFHNVNRGLCYTLILGTNAGTMDRLLDGKTLKLYARKPDEYDREMIEKEGF